MVANANGCDRPNAHKTSSQLIPLVPRAVPPMPEIALKKNSISFRWLLLSPNHPQSTKSSIASCIFNPVYTLFTSINIRHTLSVAVLERASLPITLRGHLNFLFPPNKLAGLVPSYAICEFSNFRNNLEIPPQEKTIYRPILSICTVVKIICSIAGIVLRSNVRF